MQRRQPGLLLHQRQCDEQRSSGAIDQEIGQRCAGVSVVPEQCEIDKAIRIVGLDLEKEDGGDNEHDGERNDGWTSPSQDSALTDDNVHGHHADREGRKSVPVEPHHIP